MKLPGSIYYFDVISTRGSAHAPYPECMAGLHARWSEGHGRMLAEGCAGMGLRRVASGADLMDF